MNGYPYQLAKKGKIICPSCGQRTLVPYVDASGQILHSTCGRCDREDKCGYHLPPRDYLKDHGAIQPQRPYNPPPPRPITFIKPEEVKASLYGYENNNLVKWLVGMVGEEKSIPVLSDYFVGTSSKFGGGSAIYWQIDEQKRIRTGKIMQYDFNGHRVKKPINQVAWVHSDIPDFTMKQCLFGSHLLSANHTFPVIVVESEKTALLLACIVEDAVILATGGASNISLDLFRCLEGRNVALIPDNGKFEAWSDLARQLRSFCNSVVISPRMEGPDVGEGEDIGDLFEKGIKSQERELTTNEQWEEYLFNG
ncbi:MAG: toprim domain-containing protein [Bacteroidaceae bacterium]|nr:toprim domain-containing protein [Bacteroidaceae bacterium]